MQPKRSMRRFAIVLASFVGVFVAYSAFIIDWKGRPECHTLIMLGFKNWMNSTGSDQAKDSPPFPNVSGSSQKSLAAITEEMGGYMKWTNDYNYIPGLREGDPPDLVLLYFNRPTRWNWHGAAPTIFQEKAWIIVPVDFGVDARINSRPGQFGEGSERVSSVEFRNRLKHTLDFVRTNKRPNWQAVVAEHAKFLDSLE